MLTNILASENASNDSGFEFYHIEVDDESHSLAHQTQIRQQLRFMNRQEPVHSLEFHNYLVVHKQIQSVTCIQLEPVVAK